jgi:hypothetical protein
MSRYLHRAVAAAALALATACGPEEVPIAPEPPTAQPDLAGSAFRLTIDVTSGRVHVAPPGSAGASAAGGGPSFSLIGSDGAEFRGTGTGGAIVCNWSNIPTSSKKKRCTFDFTLTNRLAFTDFVTPTSFPRPPQGTTGILVFPLSAAALGVPGGGATPSPDWDNSPANFFNDFGGCGAAKTSDCYRWERVGAPLYWGTTSELHTVGFDVDKNAQSVTAYVVVAADLRDNPPQTTTILASEDLCGYAEAVGATGTATISDPTVQGSVVASAPKRGFCGFPLSSLSGKNVVGATLRLAVDATSNEDAFAANGPLAVDHVLLGTTLTGDDFYGLGAPDDIGTITSPEILGYKEVDVGPSVADDAAQGRESAAFRLRWTNEFDGDGIVSFGRPGESDTEPQLVVRYRNN